jgi:hypothetical protein
MNQTNPPEIKKMAINQQNLTINFFSKDIVFLKIRIFLANFDPGTACKQSNQD